MQEKRHSTSYRRYVTECLAAVAGAKRLWWDVVNDVSAPVSDLWSVDEMVDGVLNRCGVVVLEEEEVK